ncbi:hypothetical protein ACTWPT_44620 [Nonomuraea sp. 3N208]|uniref:hypothetical protein n=1 Tax=Nonomuraea sp. 3N208 TaxID=3457421 RepID=UPI003FD4E9EC
MAVASRDRPKSSSAAGSRPTRGSAPVAGCLDAIFPCKDGWAGYVWVVTPEGKKTRKWCYGKTREDP